MRCLAILLGDVAAEHPRFGAYIQGIWHIRYAPQFPTRSKFFAYVEIEADRSQRGLPVDVRFEFVDGAGHSVFAVDATGVVQMPMSEELPSIFTIRPEIEMSFPQPGRYDFNIYVGGELIGSRPFAVLAMGAKRT